MMNWNQNDTKYILKRIILYFIIAGIVFFAGHSCVKANVVSRYMCNDNSNTSCDYTLHGNSTWTELPLYYMGDNRPFFANGGQGYVNFSIIAWGSSGTYNLPIYAIELTSDLNANTGNQSLFSCDIGSYTQYYDNNNNYAVMSVKCPVQIGNLGLHGIRIHKYSGNVDLKIKRSEIITFTGNVDEATAITNGTQQAINSQIQNDNTNTQAIQSTINNAIYNEIAAINNQTTAINNQTQAINNQTDWFDQDYSSIIDTEFLDVFDDLFDNDDDVVRQFILIPLNFFVLIYNACSSNTCSPIVLGELYGTTLTIPCINWSSLLGTAVTNTIDLIFAGCLVFGTIRMIKKMINKIMTLSSTITDECGVEVFK